MTPPEAECLVGHEVGAPSRSAELIGSHERKLADQVDNGTVYWEGVRAVGVSL